MALGMFLLGMCVSFCIMGICVVAFRLEQRRRLMHEPEKEYTNPLAGTSGLGHPAEEKRSTKMKKHGEFLSQ